MAKKSLVYAKALLGALENVPEKEQRVRIARFKKQLLKRGDLGLLSVVLREFKKLWEQRKGTIASVVSAAKLPLQLSQELQGALRQRGYEAKETQDELLLGGTAVFLGKEYLIDGSLQGKLRKLQSLLS